MKRFGVWLLGFGIFAIAVGCGQQAVQEPTPSPSPAPTPSVITISGTLSAGSITNKAGVFSVRSSGTKLSDYTVVAVNAKTGQTYSATTDANGKFAFLADYLDVGTVYSMNIIKPNKNYLGPVVMGTKEGASDLIMGISATQDAGLGDIVVDETNSFAQPTSKPPAAYFADNLDVGSVYVNNIKKPKGAGNYGKGSGTITSTTREGADMDKDGIPNLFDADENGDGTRNGIASVPTAAKVVSSTVESVFISSNIWAAHGTTDTAKNLIAMRLNVMAKTGRLDEITSVEVVSVPSSIRDVATVRWADSLGSPTNYPTENSLWKDSGYKLYKTTTLASNQWIISLKPKADMNVGDIFTIRVYYTSGGYQDFFVSTSYVLSDWAKIVSYNNGTTLSTSEGTSQSPRNFTASTLEVTFSKPKDEDGNILSGLRYSIRFATSEADGSGTYGVPANPAEVSVTDTGAATLSYTVSTVTAETYYVTPVAESADGQRNGEETWFRKQ